MLDAFGNNEKPLPRQKVCKKCKAFVTHNKVNDKQWGCPLCNERSDISKNFERKIGVSEMRSILAKQHAGDKVS